MMTLMLKLNKSVSIAIILFAYWRILHAANYPPRFIQQPPKNAVYNIREALKLPCVAVAEPSARYKWIKNGKEFNPAANDKRYTQWPNEGTLIFAIPEQDDDGIYQCVAYNQFGEAYSVRTNLRRANINSFKSRPDDVRHVREGQSLTLFCTVPNSYPPPVVRWMVEKKETIEYIKETNRRAVDIDGNLRIAKIESESDNGAKYFCTANNVVMRVQKDSHKTEIQVINTTPMVQQVRKMYSSPTYQTAIIGDELSIRCIFSGSPLPQIAWQKRFPDGTRIPVNEVVGLEIRHTGTELFFRNVTKENEGFYLCTGTNEVTELSHYVEFNVKTQSKPVWVKKPVDQNVDVNSQYVFECEGDGNPKPTVTWLVNGRSPNWYMDGDRKKIEGNKIILKNLLKSDHAVFQCNISNSNGYVYTNAYLNVLDQAPSFVTAPKPHYLAAETRDVVIDCITFSAPKAVVTWSLNGNPVSGGRFILQDNGNLYIKNVVPTDSGIYECIARNNKGSVKASGRLDVRQKTKIVYAPEDTRVYQDNEVKFVCTAETDPLETGNLKIEWYKDNTLLDFEVNERVSTSVQDNSLIISGAQPRDTGQYMCNATNGLDFAYATASLVVQGIPTFPTEVKVDCITKRADKIAIVGFKPGTDNYAAIIKYQIEYSTQYERETWYIANTTSLEDMDNPDSQERKLRLMTSANVKMRPNADYQFRVRAINRVGESEPSAPSRDNCRLDPALPDVNPRELYVYGDRPTNFIVRWTRVPQYYHNGNDFAYKLTIRCLDCASTPKDFVNVTQISDWRIESVRFDDLKLNNEKKEIEKYKQYEVSIISRNVIGESTAPATKTVGHSGEAIPVVTPEAPTIIRIGDYYVVLSWTIIPQSQEANVNGFFKGYRISWCLSSWSTDKCRKEVRYEDFVLEHLNLPVIYGKRKKRDVSLNVNPLLKRRKRFSNLAATSNIANRVAASQTVKKRWGEKVTFNLLGLPGAAKIKLWSRILNNQYASPMSPTVEFTTLESLPSSVEDLKLITAGPNQVYIEWQAPSIPGGVLIGYQTGVRELNGLDLGYLTKYPPSDDPAVTSETISGLKPSTAYRVYVWARTSKGNGLESFVDIMTTPVNELPVVPSFAVNLVEKNLINISFVPTRLGGVAGSIFYIQYRQPGRALWQESQREFAKRFIVIYNLPSDTLYEVRMVATNGADMTNYGKPILVRTEGEMRTTAMGGSASIWFICFFLIFLGLIALIVGLYFKRQQRLAGIRGQPLLKTEPAGAYSIPPSYAQSQPYHEEQPLNEGEAYRPPASGMGSYIPPPPQEPTFDSYKEPSELYSDHPSYGVRPGRDYAPPPGSQRYPYPSQGQTPIQSPPGSNIGYPTSSTMI